MRRFLIVPAALALLLAGCPGPHSGAGAGQTVSGAEAHRLVVSGALLLDVRSAEEFASGHAAGAQNIPVDELESRMSELPRGHTVVTYCRSGARSRRAARTLRAAGFEVRDLGTLDAWDR